MDGFVDVLPFVAVPDEIQTGNQQFTVRNVTINNAQTAIFSNWNWVGSVLLETASKS